MPPVALPTGLPGGLPRARRPSRGGGPGRGPLPCARSPRTRRHRLAFLSLAMVVVVVVVGGGGLENGPGGQLCLGGGERVVQVRAAVSGTKLAYRVVFSSSSAFVVPYLSGQRKKSSFSTPLAD